MSENERVRVEVWSDYVCPFCYLEQPDLRELCERYGDSVEVTWRAYELRPDPVPTLDPDGEYLHNTWNAAVYPMAEALGIEVHLPPVQPRSRQALELAEYARERGRFPEVHDALFAAFFRDGRDIGSREVLLEVAESAGLDREGVGADLDESRYTERVIRDQELARRLGVASVPTMLVAAPGEDLEEAEPVVGTQRSNDRLARAVDRASERGS